MAELRGSVQPVRTDVGYQFLPQSGQEDWVAVGEQSK